MTGIPVALTFDDGPSQWTAPILDLLAAHDAKATFFVVGQAVYQQPDLLVRMVDEGHEIGNHTLNHRRLSDVDPSEWPTEIGATQALIFATARHQPTLWRAPHFDASPVVLTFAKTLGLTHVYCTIDPSDWATDDPHKIAEHVIARAEPGAIVDLHDGIPPDGGTGTKSRQPTVDAVALILDAMPHARFVTVPDLP